MLWRTFVLLCIFVLVFQIMISGAIKSMLQWQKSQLRGNLHMTMGISTNYTASVLTSKSSFQLWFAEVLRRVPIISNPSGGTLKLHMHFYFLLGFLYIPRVYLALLTRHFPVNSNKTKLTLFNMLTTWIGRFNALRYFKVYIVFVEPLTTISNSNLGGIYWVDLF